MLGLAAPAAANNQDNLVTRLWHAKSDERSKILQAALNAAKIAGDIRSERGKLLYAQLCRGLIKFLRVSNSLTPEDLVSATGAGDSRARAVARLIDDTFKLPRPAEWNYLVMLLEDLDARAMPPIKALQKALAVRLLAEEAALVAPASADSAPHSESLFVWIKPAIDSADKNRRLGEDWLFGAGKQEWDTAEKYLDAADKDYRAALKDAAALRKGIDLRDRARGRLALFCRVVGPAPDVP